MKGFTLVFCGLLAMLGIEGCANTGAIKIGRDEYHISTRVAFGGPASAKGEALTTAGKYCESMSKQMMLRNIQSSECALHGGCGEAEIEFLCLAENDPRYESPVLRKDNGVTTIENK